MSLQKIHSSAFQSLPTDIFAGVAYRIAYRVNRIADTAFKFAPGLLRLTFGLVGFAFGFQIAVAGQISDSLFDFTADIFGFAFDFIVIRY
jgi:hypothetical protein